MMPTESSGSDGWDSDSFHSRSEGVQRTPFNGEHPPSNGLREFTRQSKSKFWGSNAAVFICCVLGSVLLTAALFLSGDSLRGSQLTEVHVSRLKNKTAEILGGALKAKTRPVSVSSFLNTHVVVPAKPAPLKKTPEKSPVATSTPKPLPSDQDPFLEKILGLVNVTQTAKSEVQNSPSEDNFHSGNTGEKPKKKVPIWVVGTAGEGPSKMPSRQEEGELASPDDDSEGPMQLELATGNSTWPSFEVPPAKDSEHQGTHSTSHLCSFCKVKQAGRTLRVRGLPLEFLASFRPLLLAFTCLKNSA